MQTGDLTDSVNRRSVLEVLHAEQTADLVFSFAGPLPGYADMPWRQVTAAANSLAAKDAVPLTLLLQGILPESAQEPMLKEDMRAFAKEAQKEKIAFCDARIQVSPEVLARQYFVTGIGRRGSPMEKLQVGQELVLTGWIALSGTAALARKYETELKARFPARLIERAREFDLYFSVAETARAVNDFGSYPMQPLGQGGIFRSLWEMTEDARVGLEVDLKKVPVKQETIEICEYLDINPYCLYSAGALLIGTDCAKDLIEMLKKVDIPATVIGSVKAGNERVLLNGESRRFLDRPGQDAYWRGEEK